MHPKVVDIRARLAECSKSSMINGMHCVFQQSGDVNCQLCAVVDYV